MSKRSDRYPFVVYWNNIPAPYIVERFNALADHGALEFEAWFNDRINFDRSWEVGENEWRFRYRFLESVQIGERKVRFPVPLLKKKPDILVSLYESPSFLGGWLLARVRRSKTVFWVVRTSDRWVARKPYKEWLKRWLFPRVYAFVTPGSDGKQYAESYGARSERVFFLPHSIDVDHFVAGAADAQGSREAMRSEMGLEGTTFIYVGRLKEGKGLEHLLAAFYEIQSQTSEPVSLLLVGDGPDEVKLQNLCEQWNIQNVVFLGFQQKNQLPRYYALADVFVFPTLGDPYGLVVDEAMACSLPVISTSAAGEIRDRVEEGVNGHVVPPEDSSGLAERMLRLVHDGALRERMGQASAEKVAGRTPEQWANDFENVIFALLENTKP